MLPELEEKKSTVTVGGVNQSRSFVRSFFVCGHKDIDTKINTLPHSLVHVGNILYLLFL